MNNLTLSSSGSSYSAAFFSTITFNTTDSDKNEAWILRQNPNLSSCIKVSTSFNNSITEVIVAYLKEREMPFCLICGERVSIPLRFSCGHWFDLDCMAEPMHRGQIVTCPIDNHLLQRTEASLNIDSLPETEITQVLYSDRFFRMTVPAKLNATIGKMHKLIYFCWAKLPPERQQKPIDPLIALQPDTVHVFNTTIIPQDIHTHKPYSRNKTLKELGAIPNKTFKITFYNEEDFSTPLTALDYLNPFKVIKALFSSLFS